MARVASIMRVYPGKYEEYHRRHSELWPEMRAELEKYGYRNYSIFLDERTGSLFAYYETDDEALSEKIAETPACRKWWAYMKDIMETNEDFSPVSVPLREVFHL